MKRRPPRVLRAVWLIVGALGTQAITEALRGRSAAVTWTVAVEAALVWGLVWVAVLVPRIATLTVARIGVPVAVPAAIAALVAGGTTPWTLGLLIASITAFGVLANPTTIDSFIDGSSYGPERRFALRTPAATALVAVPITWVTATAILLVPPLAATGSLVLALTLGIAWVITIRWAVRSLHLPARRWVVFVPAGMVLSDPHLLADRVLFPRRNVATIGPALATTDATDLSQGSLGLALQMDLTEPFAIPLIDRSASAVGNPSGETTVTTDRIVFAVLRPGALLTTASERRFSVGETQPTDTPPHCSHHSESVDAGDDETEESQVAVPLPRTRSSQ